MNYRPTYSFCLRRCAEVPKGVPFTAQGTSTRAESRCFDGEGLRKGEPVAGEVRVYVDYRDQSVDNYPNIYLCEEFADRVEELATLKSGESADCENCGHSYRRP